MTKMLNTILVPPVLRTWVAGVPVHFKHGTIEIIDL